MADIKPLPPVEYLQSRFVCDAEGGNLWWKPIAVIGNWQKSWNDRFAWNRAGTAIYQGYYRIDLDGCSVSVHRIIWKMHHGYDAAKFLDHISGVRSDNRIANLREATHFQNGMNKGLRIDNTTGYCGVYEHTKGGYCATINAEGRTNYIGYFKNLGDAINARALAEQTLHGRFSAAASRPRRSGESL